MGVPVRARVVADVGDQATRRTNPARRDELIRRILAVAPGLGLAGVAVTVGLIVHAVVDDVSALIVCVALGAILANTTGIGTTGIGTTGIGTSGVRASRVGTLFGPGVHFAARRLLRAGVVLLGFQLSLTQLRTLGAPGLAVVAATVAATFFGTRWMGRRLGLSDSLTLLVATGYSICGASAIAAVEGIAGADEEEVAFSIALVTLCGSLAIIALPILGHAVGIDGADYGNWVGASVHDIGQVVAAASPGGNAAVEAAVVVKLTRVVLLAPLVAGLSLSCRRRARRSQIDSGGARVRRPTTSRRSVPLVPLFVLGFLGAIVVRTLDVVPAQTLDDIKLAQTALLGAALFGLGCGVEVARLRRVGGKPLLLGLISWVLVAGVALAATTLLPS